MMPTVSVPSGPAATCTSLSRSPGPLLFHVLSFSRPPLPCPILTPIRKRCFLFHCKWEASRREVSCVLHQRAWSFALYSAFPPIPMPVPTPSWFSCYLSCPFFLSFALFLLIFQSSEPWSAHMVLSSVLFSVHMHLLVASSPVALKTTCVCIFSLASSWM